MKDITPFVKNYRSLASRLWNERVREHGGFLSEWDAMDEGDTPPRGEKGDEPHAESAENAENAEP